MEPGATALLSYLVTVNPGKFAGNWAFAAGAKRVFTSKTMELIKHNDLMFMKIKVLPSPNGECLGGHFYRGTAVSP